MYLAYIAIIKVTSLKSLSFSFAFAGDKNCPHSDVSIERVYFLVNKNKREGSERNRLDIDASLSRIFAVKLDRPDKEGQLCYLYEPTGVLTIKAKSANKAYHDAHSSKDRRFL